MNKLEMISMDIDNINIKAKCESKCVNTLKLLFDKIYKLNSKLIKDGYEIQFGMFSYFLTDYGDFYGVITPDFTDLTKKEFTFDLTFSLSIHQEQLNLSNYLNIQPIFPRYYSNVVYRDKVFKEKLIYIDKTITTSNDASSGYFILPQKMDNDNELKHIPIFKLLKEYPNIVKAMILPTRYGCIFDNFEIVAVFDDNDKQIFKSKKVKFNNIKNNLLGDTYTLIKNINDDDLINKVQEYNELFSRETNNATTIKYQKLNKEFTIIKWNQINTEDLLYIYLDFSNYLDNEYSINIINNEINYITSRNKLKDTISLLFNNKKYNFNLPEQSLKEEFRFNNLNIIFDVQEVDNLKEENYKELEILLL